MKQKGLTLIDLLIMIAILGVITAVVALNVGDFFGRDTANNETTVNQTIFEELKGQPINTLNSTALQFMVDFCLTADPESPALDIWLGRAAVYQNQIIINELKGKEVRQPPC